MNFRFLNKSISHRQFDYTPMYYDERKEQLRKKQDLYRRLETGELSDEERRDLLRQNLRKEFGRSEYRKSQQRTSNLRILMLIGVLLALGYFVFNGIDQIESVIKKIF